MKGTLFMRFWIIPHTLKYRFECPAAGIGDLRNENDANCTYEGENSLLLQQNSNWLLAVWPKRSSLNIAQESPLGSLEFLVNADEVLKKTCPWKTMDELIDPYSKH